MKKFIKPEVEVLKLQADVICTSGIPEENELTTELPEGFY